jgi:hypothetical protein
MSRVSLVCCVYKERDLLIRLLERSAGCYDELIIVHDGPDTADVRSVAQGFGAKFFERPRLGSLESQSPFAWAQASHDWIFRPDADEFPSVEMKEWLQNFRALPEPEQIISGYTCVWPLWNGKKAMTTKWPAGRIFLFNRSRVRFFGLVEQTPIADGRYEPVSLVLHHQPRRRSYGLANLVIRKQAYIWRDLIARGLLDTPNQLPCWRWQSSDWPKYWEELRRHPFRTGLSRLTLGTLRALRNQWKSERRVFPTAAVSGGLHHAMIGLRFQQLRRQELTRKKLEK